MVGIISLDISHLYKGMISLYNQKNIRIRIRNTSLIPEEEIVYITVAPFRTKCVAEGHEAWFRLLDLIAHPSDIGGCDCDWSAGKHCIFRLLFWCLASDFYLLLLWPNKHHNTLHLLRSFLGWLLFFPDFYVSGVLSGWWGVARKGRGEQWSGCWLGAENQWVGDRSVKLIKKQMLFVGPVHIYNSSVASRSKTSDVPQAAAELSRYSAKVSGPASSCTYLSPPRSSLSATSV